MMKMFCKRKWRERRKGRTWCGYAQLWRNRIL